MKLNSKFQISNFKSKDGFTLIELLASVIVLVAIGSIIAGIVSFSLRGANKTNTIENIRQNGNYALNQIAKDIKNAPPFDGINTGLGSVDNNDVTTYASSCPYDSINPTPSPVVTPYTSISLESGSNIIKYSCSPSGLLANGSSLIDTTSVSLKSCSFSCTKTRVTDVPIIKIRFTLSSANQSTLAENNSSIVFETSVTMRNYKE